jgi:hypothetical protein
VPLTAGDITASPAWLPLQVLEGASMQLLQLDETAYRAASFLDQRLLQQGYAQIQCALTLLHEAAARLEARAHYIFHTGHVGSTLVSRLIGARQSFFSLREPALLRTLAADGGVGAAGALTLEDVLALFARTWRAEQRAVIKATSFVSELAERILAAAPQSMGILMFARPRAYLQGILAGPNSRIETRQLAPARLARLQRRVAEGAWCAALRSEGEYIAMSWLCEMAALQQAAARLPAQVLWVEFDALLNAPHPALQRLFAALGAPVAPAQLESLVAGPLLQQYSKAPEYSYDAALRRAVLAEAEREHHEEIRRGMQWLQHAARESPLIAAVLERGQQT